MRIAIMGTGGLGGFFGARLAQAGMDVTFIARGESLRVMRDQGLQLHSPNGDFTIHPVQATDTPAEVGPVDLVLLCVKSYDIDAAIDAMRPMIGPATMVIPVQNGVGHVDRLRDALDEPHVLGGMSMVNAHKGAPGVIHHVTDAGQYQLEFGEWGQPVSARCEQVQQLWAAAGISGVAVDNIMERMWWKLAVFGGAAVFAVARGDKGTVWIPEVQALNRQLIEEAVAVAHAQQIPLADTLPEEVRNIADGLPPTYKPSVLVDLEQGRRLETEAINGHISRLGKALGVPTPANDFVYACLKPHMGGAG